MLIALLGFLPPTSGGKLDGGRKSSSNSASNRSAWGRVDRRKAGPGSNRLGWLTYITRLLGVHTRPIDKHE